MKIRNFALALTAAALLPTFAHAGTDAVAASFERDLDRGAVVSRFVGATDPLADEFHAALSGTTDTVLTSFERDLDREPVESRFVGAADPLADLFYAALYGTTDAVLASFERDMNREPTV